MCAVYNTYNVCTYCKWVRTMEVYLQIFFCMNICRCQESSEQCISPLFIYSLSLCYFIGRFFFLFFVPCGPSCRTIADWPDLNIQLVMDADEELKASKPLSCILYGNARLMPGRNRNPLCQVKQHRSVYKLARHYR